MGILDMFYKQKNNSSAPDEDNKVWQAMIEVKDPLTGEYIPKKTLTTMYPKSWSETRIKYELAEAIKKIPKDNKYPIVVRTPAGVKVQFVPYLVEKRTMIVWRAWPLMENQDEN